MDSSFGSWLNERYISVDYRHVTYPDIISLVRLDDLSLPHPRCYFGICGDIVSLTSLYF